MTLHWYNGAETPGARAVLERLQGGDLDWGDEGEKRRKDHAGAFIVGSKATIRATGHNATFTLLPADKFGDFEGLPESVPRSPGHEKEWPRACRGDSAALSNFDYASKLAELRLGNVATRFDQALEFDPVAGKIVNCPEADALLGSEYREGWAL